MDVEKRFLPQRASGARVVAQRGRGRAARIVGYGAVFYDASDPGTEFEIVEGVFERIMPGAFDRSLRENDVRSLFNHDTNFVLGRTSAGTLKLTTDARGLRYRIDVPEAQTIRDLVLSPVERGDVSGSSFMFLPRDSRWLDRPDGSLVREIHDVDLVEVGPVTFPAYQSTTSDVGRQARRRSRRRRREAIRRRLRYVELMERESAALRRRPGRRPSAREVRERLALLARTERT